MKDNLDDDPWNLLPDSLVPQKKKRCWFGHSWSNWEDTDDIGKLLKGGDKVGRYVYQERRCARCNKLELNKVVSRTRE